MGFIVNKKEPLMDEDKIKPILEFPTPKNVKRGIPTHATEKRSRMEVERKTRTGFGEN